MFENLDVFLRRKEELTARMYDPAVAADPDRLRDVMQELSDITPLADTYAQYLSARQAATDALSLLEETNDPELHELAQEELRTAQAREEELDTQLRILLLPRDPRDAKSVVVEIRAGAGGEEAALFSADLYRMYTMYAERQGWKTEIGTLNETELGGIREISFMIEGQGAFSRLKFESGVHRVQRVPVTESQGRIQTSTATVAIMPEVDDVEVQIDPKDLRIDTFRSSGAGGQHINKTSSAIRITHLPTGLVVECQDERSQYKNKDKAMKVLRARLFDREQQKRDSEISQARRAQVGSGDRSERIRTYNFPQGRVTDHRIGLTLYRIQDIMNGDLNELIDALTAADRAEKLRAVMEPES